MDNTLKKVIGILAAVFILSVAYYGSYLPLVKSMAFISAMQSTGNVKTLQEFENVFKTPLDMPSPIGQEELVRNTTSNILGTIQNVNDSRVAVELNRFVVSYYDPIISRGKGMSFGQDLYILGAVNEVSYMKTQDAKYLDAAQSYYQKAVDAGPSRPQGLYGLFDVYRIKNDTPNVEAIANRILMLWPTDNRTRDTLAAYLAAQTAPSPKKPVAH